MFSFDCSVGVVNERLIYRPLIHDLIQMELFKLYICSIQISDTSDSIYKSNQSIMCVYTHNALICYII